MMKFTDTDGNEVLVNTRNVTRVFMLDLTAGGQATAIEVAGCDRLTLVPNTMAEVAAMLNQPATMRPA